MTKKKKSTNQGSSNGHSHDDALDQLVVTSMAAWEAGDFDKALQIADQACALAPDQAVAHHCRAAALAELDRVEEARVACERGVQLAPDDPDALAYAADFYLACLDDDQEGLERGLALADRGVKVAAELRDEEIQAECLLLRGRAQEILGRPGEALSSVEEALQLIEDDEEALLERGILLFELCRFEDAEKQMQALAEAAPDLAAPRHYLGLIEERRGNRPAAERHFEAAAGIDPEEFRRPVQVSAAEFDGVLEEALRQLPEKIRHYLSNVAITVEELPAEEDLRVSDPPLSPLLLGIFRGSPLGEKGLLDPWSHFPSSIVLYQKNLERIAEDRDDLVQEIGITLIHEVGHFLGLDEHDLMERGLD